MGAASSTSACRAFHCTRFGWWEVRRFPALRVLHVGAVVLPVQHVALRQLARLVVHVQLLVHQPPDRVGVSDAFCSPGEKTATEIFRVTAWREDRHCSSCGLAALSRGS